ncbi:prepilin peptidase-dependent protein [Kalamiella sp. sgz302252]|uniref:prepilin peptidase-dependent protein n=1 Tax=Pantoea sp. sgz302252 TaxID=3341827 RepID=UPI0036D2EAFC
MNRQGFTLAELIIVMAIASLLTISGISGWQQWQQTQRLNASARQIQHFLLRLRSEANWHNQQALLWKTSGTSWCLGSGPMQPHCSARQRKTLLAPWPEIKMVSLTEGMGFYGRRNVAKPGRIVIANAAGERHIILSSRARVRLCKGACP